MAEAERDPGRGLSATEIDPISRLALAMRKQARTVEANLELPDPFGIQSEDRGGIAVRANENAFAVRQRIGIINLIPSIHDITAFAQAVNT